MEEGEEERRCSGYKDLLISKNCIYMSLWNSIHKVLEIVLRPYSFGDG